MHDEWILTFSRTFSKILLNENWKNDIAKTRYTFLNYKTCIWLFTGKSRKSRPRNENCLLPVENVHVVCFGKLRRRWVYDVIKNKCVKIKGCSRPGNNFQKRLECKSQCVRRRKGKKLGWINFPLQVWNSTPVKKGVCTTSLYNSGVWTCRLVWAQVPVSTYDDDFLHHPINAAFSVI